MIIYYTGDFHTAMYLIRQNYHHVYTVARVIERVEQTLSRMGGGREQIPYFHYAVALLVCQVSAYLNSFPSCCEMA